MSQARWDSVCGSPLTPPRRRPHVGHVRQILIPVCLVDVNLVYAQRLKALGIVRSIGHPVAQFPQARFVVVELELHLLLRPLGFRRIGIETDQRSFQLLALLRNPLGFGFR